MLREEFTSTKIVRVSCIDLTKTPKPWQAVLFSASEGLSNVSGVAANVNGADLAGPVS